MQDFGHETVGIVQYIIANLTASIISVTGSDNFITSLMNLNFLISPESV